MSEPMRPVFRFTRVPNPEFPGETLAHLELVDAADVALAPADRQSTARLVREIATRIRRGLMPSTVDGLTLLRAADLLAGDDEPPTRGA